jgi:hypothetical protein
MSRRAEGFWVAAVGMLSTPRPVAGGPGRKRTAALLAAALLACVPRVYAQSIEPRAYADVPVGVNFLIGGFAYAQGDLATDALPVTGANFDTSNAILAYARSLDLWGKSAKIDAAVPYSWLSGSADYAGQPVSRHVNGFGDPNFRLAVNLFGAPALTPQQFATYHQDLVIGVSLQVTPPLGQYDSTRVVNLGTNRWTFKPEIGASKALGRWILELQAAVAFYTDNTDFYNGHTRAQDPIYQLQQHVIYGFSRGVWASVDATFYAGGRSTLNGTLNSDLQQNWRVGATLALPLNRYNSLKLYASDGVSARTGNNSRLFGIALQHRWGGGI